MLHRLGKFFFLADCFVVLVVASFNGGNVFVLRDPLWVVLSKYDKVSIEARVSGCSSPSVLPN